MHPYLRYYLLMFISYGLVFLLLHLGIDYFTGDSGESLAGAVLATVLTTAFFAAFMLYMEVRGLKKAGVKQIRWDDLGGDYGEELSMPLSVKEILGLLAEDVRFLLEDGVQPGEYKVLNRVYGHYGKHRTYLVVLEEGEGRCTLRLENRFKNAYQLSDLGYSRQQYEEIKSVLLRERQKWADEKVA
ncbi:MAG: hypothetical protein GVY26_02485 [Bacteroidetes bacterium]|jgi:hypothetical protein|nr:hypothetical protein [Bacteroidota bacterium]